MSTAVQSALSSTPLPPQGLMTEDEFLERHGGENNTELIDGVVVRYPTPGSKHGRACTKLSTRLDTFTEENRLGRVVNCDTFVRVKINPPRVRGADVAYLSFAKWPEHLEFTDGPLPAAPELVGEVKSPSDTWPQVVLKVNDYLQAGVLIVLVLDPSKRTITAYRSGVEPTVFVVGDILIIPDVLPGFSVPVASLFQ